ncbi:hypothetical protein FOMA001_g15591 [Fusarium oxysporum f. sp. matthiolae]|nr:hypothetical protein FOMA001_g15591 [Fusarium oxysporum f. sp. matthiolae]
MSRVGLFPSKNISSFSSCGTCVIALRFSKAGAVYFPPPISKATPSYICRVQAAISKPSKDK